MTLAAEQLVTISNTGGDSEINGTYVHGAIFTLTDEPTRYSIENKEHMTEQMTLKSITLNSIYMHNPNEGELTDVYPVYLYIIDSDDRVLGISDLIEVKAYKKDGDIVTPFISDYTFSFDSDITLTLGSTYNVLFKQADTAVDPETGKADYYSALRFLNSKKFIADLAGDATEWGITDQLGNPLSVYNPWGFSMSMELSPHVSAPSPSAPEPATATLSLMALMAMISHRRRRSTR